MNRPLPSDPRGRVSIALCTYNGERYLPEQLHSFASQTYQPFELVVCDDGSSDGTLDLLRSFAQDASFPVHIHANSKNLGPSRNFERAMGLCTGDFIALSDQDDLWLPGKVEVLAALLNGNPEVAGVFSDGELIDENSRPLGSGLWDTFGFGSLQQSRFLRKGAAAVLITRVVVTGATLMVRSAARPLFLPVPPAWVHDGWIAWMLAIYAKLSFSTERLIRYRVHPSQQVGIGANSLAERIRRARTTAAGDYLSLADQLTVLRDHLMSSRSGCDAEILRQLDGKIAHCRWCATMPANPIQRAAIVLSHFRDYRRYTRPLRSMCRDCLGAF